MFRTEKHRWCPAGRVVRVNVWLVLACLALAQPVLAQPCREQPVVSVETSDEELRALICPAATQAIAFLAGYHLTADRPIVIGIVESSIDNHGYIAYGSYDSRTDRIELMSPASIRSSSAEPQMYNEPFDDIYYRGAVAHEVAHAIVQQHLKVKPLSTAPQEYLAHATQLAILPAERRERIIARANVQPWLPGDTIGDVYLALEPTGFAVKSYLHLTGLADPRPFVELLLRTRWFYFDVPD